jgi:hypothetical protein
VTFDLRDTCAGMVIVSTNLPTQTQVAPNPVVFLPITNQRKLCMGQMAHMLHPVWLNGVQGRCRWFVHGVVHGFAHGFVHVARI